MDLEKRAIQRQMLDVVEAIKVERLPPGSESNLVSKPSMEVVSQRHHLAGLAVHGNQPVLLLRLPDSTTDAVLDARLLVLPWGWPGKYGASVTLTCFFASEIDERTRIAIPQADAPTLDLLSEGRITLVLMRGRRPVAAYLVDFTARTSTLEDIRRHVANVRSHTASVFADEAG